MMRFIICGQVEVGGTKGKTLTASVKQIHDDFQSAVNKFRAVPYDIMDVSAKQFDDDFYEFRYEVTSKTGMIDWASIYAPSRPSLFPLQM